MTKKTKIYKDVDHLHHGRPRCPCLDVTCVPSPRVPSNPPEIFLPLHLDICVNRCLLDIESTYFVCIKSMSMIQHCINIVLTSQSIIDIEMTSILHRDIYRHRINVMCACWDVDHAVDLDIIGMDFLCFHNLCFEIHQY